ncbi:hypothetical protein EV207_11951 [Scopulibacillus darangshiensis]|uniref:Uncharacterized protein n=1 Tax=Scopulibacillus darangshiensis TaxID=442528 RepID=A0A4R2NWY9_9BACL|nr:hypothetical protein [Scopulibacillus darangshiensis]TCP26620.1 hypothetical protein EV207_11951 [Scopulibacillus darangshiensis]
MEEKNIGIDPIALERLLDKYILKSGDTITIDQLRIGLEKIIVENNKALMKDIEALIDNKMK